jgi:hypothetical protein
MRNAAGKPNAGAEAKSPESSRRAVTGKVVSIARLPWREAKTKRLQSAFLAACEECGNVAESSRCAGIGRNCHHVWLKKDKDYRGRFEESVEIAADVLLGEARRRAVDGYEEPVDAKNPAAGAIRKYSNEMLMFLLKSMKPEVYREHFRAGTVVVSGRVLDLSKLNGDQLREVEAIIRNQDQSLEAKNTGSDAGIQTELPVQNDTISSSASR